MVDKIAKKDQILSCLYQGCYTLDEFPKQLKTNCLYIVSDQPKNIPISHFRAVATLNNTVSFFCSFGKKPEHSSIISSLQSLGKKIVYNTIPVQHSNSATCSLHCLFVNYLISRQFTLEEILQRFYSFSDPYINDERVSHFISVVFRETNLPFYDSDFN